MRASTIIPDPAALFFHWSADPGSAHRFGKSSHSRQFGFTLLELLLSIALLSILIAISVPTLGSLFSEQNRLQVVGKIEEFLGDKRRDAIQSAQPCWIRFSADDRYLIAGRLHQPAHSMLTLPETMQFVSGEFVYRLESEQLGEMDVSALETTWSAEYLFYPDGTAKGAEVIVREGDADRYRIGIDSLSGTIKIQRLDSTAVAGGIR